jgi:nucleotide-binding universal stress UspA family protein
LEIIGPDEATVYLLHVCASKSSRLTENVLEKGPAEMLEQWKNSIMETKPLVTVHNEILFGSPVQQYIISKAVEWQVDVIVIGQKSNHSWFPFLNKVMPVELSDESRCAVLTVKPGALRNKIKTLVMPVSGSVSSHKTEAITTLCRKFKLKIHLVTFMDEDHSLAEFSASSLLKVYQWLKASMRCPVEYAVLQGDNKAKAILDYSKKVEADILLLNSNSESRIGRWKGHIPDVLPAASRMQVLTV